MIDVGNRNSAIGIIFTLDMIFFATAVTLMLFPHTKDIGNHVWEVFMGANGALMLLLNAEGKKEVGINGNGSSPTLPGSNPAQPQQTTK